LVGRIKERAEVRVDRKEESEERKRKGP